MNVRGKYSTGIGDITLVVFDLVPERNAMLQEKTLFTHTYN